MKLKNLQGRENMKKIFTLYKRDIHSIITNIMSIVLIGGLIFLPSLYAWLNIKASWDPYAQTDQIPIGFVNEDEGATVRGEAIHVGNDLEDELKENDNFRSEEHTSELQSRFDLVCRLLLE